MKIIFGFDTKYEDILEQETLQTLKERRVIACEQFAAKLLASDRFSYLFPKYVYGDNDIELRKRKTYIETFARTERLYNSPLFAMRRQLNE